MATGLTPEEIEELRAAFSLFDPHKTGQVHPSELKTALLSLNAEDPDRHLALYQLVADLDKHQQPLNLDQFTDLMTGGLGKKSGGEDTARTFRMFDLNHKGSVNAANLKRVADDLGERLTMEEAKEMIRRADRDGDGEVTLEDFQRILSRTA